MKRRNPANPTNRTVNALINEGFLKQVKESVPRVGKAHFVYRSDIRYYKRKVNRRKKLIGRYSKPAINKARRDYAEMLFKFMFKGYGFQIVALLE